MRRLLFRMPERFGLRVLGLVGIQLVLSGLPASGFCPPPHPRVSAEFFKSDAVFVGTVVSEHTQQDDGGWFYRLRVQKIYRGPVRKSITVYTENSSGRFPLDVGRQYLLFAYLFQGELTIDNCGNSALLSEAKDFIRQLEQLKNPGPTGEIEGHVIAYSDEDVSRIRVVAHRGKTSYSAFTDQNGWFHMRVLPGRYSLRGKSSHLTVYAYDLSYDGPDDFVVHRGSTAELQLVARRK